MCEINSENNLWHYTSYNAVFHKDSSDFLVTIFRNSFFKSYSGLLFVSWNNTFWLFGFFYISFPSYFQYVGCSISKWKYNWLSNRSLFWSLIQTELRPILFSAHRAWYSIVWTTRTGKFFAVNKQSNANHLFHFDTTTY